MRYDFVLAPLTLHAVVTAMLAVVGAAAIASAMVTGRRRHLARRRRMQLVVVAAGILAAAALTLAAFDLSLIRRDELAGIELVVALDVSESAARTPSQLEATTEHVAALVIDATRALTAAQADAANATIVHFAADSIVSTRLPLTDLPTALTDRSARRAVTVDGTDIGGALDAAAEHLEGGAAVGAILLVSDGLDTTAGPPDVVRLRRAGIPIMVVPVASPNPGAGLVASYLPARVRADSPSTLRLVLRNVSDEVTGLDLGLSIVGSGERREHQSLEPRSWRAVRAPMTFHRRGLQPVDLHVSSPHTGETQTRRHYTLVTTPPRVHVAGDARLLRRALAGSDLELSEWRPGTPLNAAEYDAIVLNAVAASELTVVDLAQLRHAVSALGTGLLVINGAHAGSTEKATVLMSYDGTPIESLLPLTSQPRAEVPEPPARNVTILIDTSGSMKASLAGRTRLDYARAISQVIVSRLNWRDRASIVAFSGGFDVLLPPTEMGASGKQAALAALATMQAGGGTDPRAAMAHLAGRALLNCGLFFISDAEFGVDLRQPGCMTTVFSVGNADPGGNVRAIGEVHIVDGRFDPRRIQLGFFDPKPRTRTFEPGRFWPDWLDRHKALWPSSPLSLDGTAVTYPRDDSELVAVRPWPLDPVLAFRREQAGMVAEMTSGLDGDWHSDAGANALEAWIRSLLSWRQRDRYELTLSDANGRLRLTVAILTDSGDVPERLTAALDIVGESTIAIPLQPDSTTWGVFHGELALPTIDAPRDGIISLLEAGQGRAEQIPILLPPPLADVAAGNSVEAWTFGLAEARLRSLADQTGGIYDVSPEQLFQFAGAQRTPPRRELRPWLLVFAVAAYLAQIALMKLGRS